jgi:toluene monooxygenase system protein B
MATFPISSAVEGDFCLKLVSISSEDTVDAMCAAAAAHSVGRTVAPRARGILRARKQGHAEFLAGEMSVGEAGIQPLQCIEFLFVERPAP